MRLVAGADQVDLAALRLDHREMPRRILHREDFCRRMVRSLPAEIRIGRWADARSEPDLTLLVIHRIVCRGLAVPDHLLAPVGRRRKRIVLRRRCLRITHRHAEGRRLVAHRIKHRDDVGRVLDRAIDQAVGVQCRLALVGRGDVVQVVLGIGKIPLRDDDVALAPLRARRLRGRQFTRRDAVGPVGEQAERALRVQPADRGRHVVHRLAGQDAARPGVFGLHVGEHRRDRARRLVAERVAGVAAVGLHDVEPLGLGLEVVERKFVLRRYLQHRVPVDRRIALRRLRGRRRRGGEVDDPARVALLPRRIHHAVAAREHLVIRLGQIGDEVAALVVGHHALDQPRRQVGGFGDHPHAGLRSVRTRHHAADVLIADRRRLLCVCRRRKSRRDRRRGYKHKLPEAHVALLRP